MRSHLEDAVEGEFLIDEVEEVTPIPGVVFDDSMGIKLDPEVESDKGQATHPACKSHEHVLTIRTAAASDGKAAIGDKVGH
jgi:hypothetical protein